VAGNSAGIFVGIALYLRGLTTQNNEPELQIPCLRQAGIIRIGFILFGLPFKIGYRNLPVF